MTDTKSHRLGCTLVVLLALLLWALIALAAALSTGTVHAQTPTPTPYAGPWCWMGGNNCYPQSGTCMGSTIAAGLPCPPADVPTPTPGGPTPTATPTPAGTQLYCHTTGGLCFAYPSPIGLSCDTTPNSTPCAVATPTPTATQTATPVPAITQPTIITVKLGLPVAWTYTQGLSLFRGVLWGNAGNAPGTTYPGECIFSVDYTRDPPPFRVWTCSGLTPDTWETGYPKVGDDAQSGLGAIIVTWIETHSVPPWGQSNGAPTRYGSLSMLRAMPRGGAGTFAVDDPNAYISRDAISESQAWLWPLAWLNIGGQRMLYVGHVSTHWGTLQNCLVRYFMPQGNAQQWMDSASFPPVNYPMASISDIAIDADGSLIATETLGENATATQIWRSLDEGHTWAIAATILAQPGGSLFDCHFAHGAGGAAQVPWLLTCNSTPPTGNWQNGGWGVVTVAWPGAVFPDYWGKSPAAPVQAQGLMQVQAKSVTTAAPAVAPLSQIDVLRQLGIKKP
jgi:hypothetical protein